jgi:hypothetical protein
MEKIYFIFRKLLKNKLILKSIYYFWFFLGSIFILSGLGNFFSDNNETIGLVSFLVGIVIITILGKYEKIF